MADIISSDEFNSKDKQGPNELILDLENLLLSTEYSDFTIIVESKTFNVHSLILKVRSPYFKAMFNNDWIENQRGQMEVATHRSDTVAAALKYMYTGSTTGISLISVDVLGLASEWSLKGLKEIAIRKCYKILKKLDVNRIVKIPEVIKILRTANLHDIKDLEKEALDFILRNLDDFKKHDEWKDLSTNPAYMPLFVNFFENYSRQKRFKPNH